MSDVKCTSCGKQRFELKEVSSKLLPGMKFLMCNDCIAKGWEPRWAIVMAGQQYGTKSVRQHVVNHKYHGEKITLEEVV